MEKNDPKGKTPKAAPGSNSDQQAVDKNPGEERGSTEQVTKEDLKGKKVDADPKEEKSRK